MEAPNNQREKASTRSLSPPSKTFQARNGPHLIEPRPKRPHRTTTPNQLGRLPRLLVALCKLMANLLRKSTPPQLIEHGEVKPLPD